MANPAWKIFVIWRNSLKVIVYVWESTNGIVMNNQGTDWSWNGCKLVKSMNDSPQMVL